MNELYVAPEVEVLEVQVEKGFAATGGQAEDIGQGDPYNIFGC